MTNDSGEQMIKRYDLFGEYDPIMTRVYDGDFVRYDDIKHLLNPTPKPDVAAEKFDWDAAKAEAQRLIDKVYYLKDVRVIVKDEMHDYFLEGARWMFNQLRGRK